MKDGYDVATALKDIDRWLPKAGEIVREYIEILKSRAPKVEEDSSREYGSGHPHN